MTLADEGSHQNLNGNVYVVVDTNVDYDPDFLLFFVVDGVSISVYVGIDVDLDILVWL